MNININYFIIFKYYKGQNYGGRYEHILITKEKEREITKAKIIVVGEI